jgi:arsenate reductase (thioredoxin)
MGALPSGIDPDSKGIAADIETTFNLIRPVQERFLYAQEIFHYKTVRPTSMTRQIIKILVLCTGNSCRSQMAEGFFRHYGAGFVDVHSAGIFPVGVNPRAIQVMSEAGVDISSQTSKHLSIYLKESFDYVITVCDNAAANCPVFPGAGKRLHWPFPDPADAIGGEKEIMMRFRFVRDQISACIKNWLGELNISISEPGQGKQSQ